MRIQILELPSVPNGDTYETPFAIIVDGMDGNYLRHHDGEIIRSTRRDNDLDLENFHQTIGAKAVFVSPEPIEIVRN